MKSLQVLQSKLDYVFKEVALLNMAMTHKSFCVQKNVNIKHNERLEFLGDAFLGLIIAELLMEKFPLDPEGALSKKRASLINQEILSKKAKELSLHELLILGPGEREQESHLKPRLLASAFEAILGALYLDAGLDLTKKYIISEFSKDIENIDPEVDYEKDYKTRLQELTQKLKLGTPQYELVSSTGPSHKPEFLVSIQLNAKEKMRAAGSSKKIAEQKAAQLLFAELKDFVIEDDSNLKTQSIIIKQKLKTNTKKGNKS